MEIKQLRYFKRVADAGSVSRAAAALSVAQPAVSRQIANLEEALGTALFFRNGRGVTLTDAGTQLYAHTEAILDNVRNAEQDVRDSVGVARGTLVVGTMPSVIRVLAPPLLRFMERHHPGVTLEFTSGMSGYVNEWLSNGLLDIAIIHDATRTQHFLTEDLICEELVAVGRRGASGSVALADLAREPLILPRRSHGLRLQLERAASALRVPLNVRYEGDGFDATLELVAEDLGITVMPRTIAAPLRDVAVRTITDPVQSRQLLLATSSQRPVSQAARILIQEVKRMTRQLAGTRSWPGAWRPGEVSCAGAQGRAGQVPVERAA